MENKRSTWGSNFGFLMAAIGSAVGLGNIWGFPYKMGKSGGFTFLLIYLLLALFVGLTICVSELALGRKTGKGAFGAYRLASKKFKWIGALGVLAPFLIMSFYAVLGGYCIQYMSLNLAELSFGLSDIFGTAITGTETFGAMLTNPFGCFIFTLMFLVICTLIVQGGISGGIEKFNKVGMPALAVMLVIVIIRSLTLPNAVEGLKFMFVPGYAVKAGFISEAPGVISVLATAGGQMFFSLSLAMGVMITYGSYLHADENLVKNSGVIVIADTIIATLAGIAVIPASVANGINNGLSNAEIAGGLGGPKLLFVTLQDVFSNMGKIGPLFGVIFYLLVLIAAISSAISLTEVVVTFILDNQEAKGKVGNRKNVTLWVIAAIAVEALIVAADGLGSNGIDPASLMGIAQSSAAAFLQDWLDFMDCWSEGIAMPLGALLMSIMIGWEIQPKYILDEVHHGESAGWFNTFYTICVKFIVPLVMAFILAGSMIDFFGSSFEVLAYVISGVIVVVALVFALKGAKEYKGAAVETVEKAE
jgi:NSS family neurotransmitter:Na+ symporter